MRSEEWRPATAACNRRLGRHGTPPARHYDLAARSSLDGSGANAGEGSAGPEPKIATVEHREASVPRYGTQGASLGAWPARVMGRPNGCLASTRTSLGAPPPLIRGAKRKFHNPGAENASRERDRLFDLC